MLKLANQVLDAYDDVELAGIKKLAAINPNINVMTPDERALLADTDYALTAITKKAHKLNKFPINNFDNTWLSNRFFEMNHQKLAGEAASVAAYHIKKACERFGIETMPAVEGLSKEASSNIYYEGNAPERAVVTKTAVMDKLAEADQISNNYTFAQYAIPTAGHVKLACAYFEKHADKMPLETRHKYAAAIQKRAHELGLPAQKGTVCKYASDHYSGAVDAHVRIRASLLDAADPKFKGALDKLASMKKQLSPSEFAQALHGLDKRAKLDRYYGGYLSNPYEATFAQEPDHTYSVKTARGDLSGDDLKKIAFAKEAKIKEYFGSSISDAFKKDPAAIFDSLPNDAKDIIANIAYGQL